MKRITLGGVLLVVAAGCGDWNDIIIDNTRQESLIVNVGWWERIPAPLPRDDDDSEEELAWRTGTYRVNPLERRSLSFLEVVEVGVYRESDGELLYHRTGLWDETITITP